MSSSDDPPALRIGQAARASSLDPRTIRYYDSIGLVRASGRTAAGYRLYTAHEVEALRFVRRARRLGLSLDEARKLLETWRRGEPLCSELDDILRRHLGEIDSRIHELEELRDEMRAILAAPARKAGGSRVCPKLAAAEGSRSGRGR